MKHDIPFDATLIFQPLAQEDACGEDLRYDVVYDRIPEFARSEPEGLPMGVWEREIKKSDWGAVASLCYEILTARSKDLQVAAWFGEALSYLYGASGAALGWKVFTGLATNFWNDIHPRIAENDIELRVRPVYSFAKQTDQWLAVATSLASKDHDSGVQTSASLQQERSALRELISEVMTLQSFLDQQLGDKSPTLHGLYEPIRNRLAVLGPELEEASGSGDAPQNSAGGANYGRHGRVDSRDTAYAAIRDVAQYLGKTEPHSPVPMILEAIADWRDCQFSDLLARMPKENASLYELMKFFRQT